MTRAMSTKIEWSFAVTQRMLATLLLGLSRCDLIEGARFAAAIPNRSQPLRSSMTARRSSRTILASGAASPFHAMAVTAAAVTAEGNLEITSRYKTRRRYSETNIQRQYLGRQNAFFYHGGDVERECWRARHGAARCDRRHCVNYCLHCMYNVKLMHSCHWLLVTCLVETRALRALCVPAVEGPTAPLSLVHPHSQLPAAAIYLPLPPLPSPPGGDGAAPSCSRPQTGWSATSQLE